MSLRDLLIRLGGHDPLAMRGESREATQPIAMAGSTVLVAALVTAVNWAIAGHSLAGGDMNASAATAAAVGALLGFLLVSTLDRAGIYQMDTQAGRPFRKAVLLMVRVMVVLLVSGVTTGAIAPRLLEAELKAHSLQMREQADLARVHALDERFSMATLQNSLTQRDANVDGARKAVMAVPSDIRVRQERGNVCWRGYANRRAYLLQQGYSEGETRKQLAPLAGRCSADTDGARRDLEIYGERSRKALAEAERQQDSARLTLNQAGIEIANRLAEAGAVEKDAITPKSSIVLASLLASDKGAWMKWHAVYAFIICLELLPLVLKLLSERSVPGVRIAADREISTAAHERRREAAHEDQHREVTLRAAMDNAMDQALASPEVRDQSTRLFQSKVEALIPIEIAKRLTTEIVAGAQHVEAAMRRHPDYARVIAEAWEQAIDEVLDRLRTATARRAVP